MKQTIYLIAIIIMFAACKQNFTTKEASEAITEEIATSPAIVDSATTVVPQQTIVVEQPKETSKLDLPFVGKRNFAFTDGVVNDNFITIKSDGMVMFSSSVVNFDKNDNPNGYKEDIYFKGKYADIIKETPNGTIIEVDEETYYKIEGNMIYIVDKNGVKNKDCGDEQNELCGTSLEKI